MGMGFGQIDGEDVEGQLTLDSLMRKAAKDAARDEVKDALHHEHFTDDRILQTKREALEHTDTLRDELGSLTRLKPLERYALVQLARALAKDANKKRIKRRIKAMLGETK